MTSPAGLTLAAVLASPYPPAKAFELATRGVSQQITTLPCLLYGWSLDNNSTTTAAVARIYDGDDTSNEAVVRRWLQPQTGAGVLGGPPGILMRNGVYVYCGSVNVNVTVYLVQLLTSG